MRKAKESPGPPDYADYLMKDMSQDINGGRFSNANPKTEIEWVQLRETPGPNEYVLKYKLHKWWFIFHCKSYIST